MERPTSRAIDPISVGIFMTDPPLFLLRINTDLRPFVHRLHNPDHIALTDCHTAARIRIASRTMQKDGRTLAKSTFRVVINCQHIIIMRNI